MKSSIPPSPLSSQILVTWVVVYADAGSPRQLLVTWVVVNADAGSQILVAWVVVNAGAGSQILVTWNRGERGRRLAGPVTR